MVRGSPPEALVPAVPTEAQSQVHGFPAGREAVAAAAELLSIAASVIWTLCHS